MKTIAVFLTVLAVSSAIDVDWSKVTPRHVVPKNAPLIPETGPTGRITGGKEAVPNSLPYQVGLMLQVAGGTSFCGGILIDPQWVLTAGHCVDGVSEANVILGAHKIRDSSEAGRVEIIVPKSDIFLHEKYNPSTIQNDIGLIRIPEVTLTENIQTINLPRSSQLKDSFDGRDAIASGWGRPSDAQQTIAEELRYIDTKIMKLSTCKLNMLFLPTDQNICIDGKNGKSACNGDSGGPLVVTEADGTRTAVGIASFVVSFGCEKNFPAAYVRITSHMDWIVKNTNIPVRS